MNAPATAYRATMMQRPMLDNANLVAFLQYAHLAFRSAILSSSSGAPAGAEGSVWFRLNKLAGDMLP